MDREALLQLVRATLSHLNQEPLLQIDPLAEVLAPDVPLAARGAALKRILLDAMQQLRPPHVEAYHSPAWRRYRSLFQHYIEEKAFEDIADEQGISSRQARRDHHEAVEALGSVVFAKLLQIEEAQTSGAEPPGQVDSIGQVMSVEDELRRVALSPPSRPTEVGETLERVVEVVRPLAAERDTRIELSLNGQFAPLAAGETALRQALLGLLSYAIESAPGGLITVRAAPAAFGVELWIGVAGWDGETPKSLDASERLTISRRMLEAQGDGLELRSSDPGRVLLRLTLLARELPRVLVVDDNPDVVRLFQRFLDSAGYRLIQATNAQAALQLAHETRPRAITLDLMMPGQDGWELLQELRQHAETRQIPIIVCSVLPERALAMASGATLFLPKPVTRLSLLAALEEACSRLVPACSPADNG